VEGGDSGGISVTGETPQEHGFRDEEAHRTPHGTRPPETEINTINESFFSKTNETLDLCN